MEFYTPTELSKMLKVEEDHVRRLLRKEKLKGIKIGKYWRVKKKYLQEYLEQKEEKFKKTDA
ncbi:MAG: helix-turn-helix domain-containing protein [Candidatus Woesearchaeota archaeon]